MKINDMNTLQQNPLQDVLRRQQNEQAQNTGQEQTDNRVNANNTQSVALNSQQENRDYLSNRDVSFEQSDSSANKHSRQMVDMYA